MWTYTAYILWKLFQQQAPKDKEIVFEDFAEFIFNDMWQKEKLVFHDGKSDLYSDLKYLEQLKVLDLEEGRKQENAKIRIKNKERLSKVAKLVDSSANLTTVELFDEYKKRIDRAVKEHLQHKLVVAT